jgi:hypothetical protein
MAVLTEGDDHGGAASRECSGAAEAAYWRDFFDERAAHREFDGGYSRADAERLAFGEMILDWHHRYGARPDPHRCAGCGDDMPSDGDLALSDGARVHFDAVRRVGCIIACGRSGGVLQQPHCASWGSIRHRVSSCGRNRRRAESVTTARTV